MEQQNKLYECLLVNKTDTQWAILEKGGSVMLRLPPGEEETLHSYLPHENLYSRFSLIRRNGDGSFTVKVNKEWPQPESWKGRWLLECLNDGPNEHEVIRVNDRAVHLYKGVPLTVPVDCDDPLWSWYEKITIKEITEKAKDPEHEGYFVQKTKVVTEKTIRPDSDLKKIKAEIDAKNVKRGERKIVIPKDIAAKLK